jgi:hypothetical protein
MRWDSSVKTLVPPVEVISIYKSRKAILKSLLGPTKITGYTY